MFNGNIDTLDINGNIDMPIINNGDIDISLQVDGNIDATSLDGKINTPTINGDVSIPLNLDTDVSSTLNIRATISPITPSTNDYVRLINKPQINSVELVDNKSLDDLNIQVKGEYADSALTNTEIEELLNNFS